MPSVTAKTIKAGVIGWPVEHSLSPRLHGYWLDTYGIDGVYLPLPVAPRESGTGAMDDGFPLPFFWRRHGDAMNVDVGRGTQPADGPGGVRDRRRIA